MQQSQKAFAPKGVSQRAGRRFPVFYLGCLMFGAALFFAPQKSSANLFELTLDPDGLGRTNVYDYYAWSGGRSWEVTESVLADKTYFNLIFTFDVTPNLIGMHLLDIEKSGTYNYDLGYVLIATFGWTDDVSGQPASGDVDYSSNDSDFLRYFNPFGIPRAPSGNVTPPIVPEPITMTLLTAVASLAFWKRRRSGI